MSIAISPRPCQQQSQPTLLENQGHVVALPVSATPATGLNVAENRKILVNRRQFVITFGEVGRLYCDVNAASSLMTLNLRVCADLPISNLSHQHGSSISSGGGVGVGINDDGMGDGHHCAGCYLFHEVYLLRITPHLSLFVFILLGRKYAFVCR